MLELSVIGGTQVWINALRVESVRPGTTPDVTIVATVDGQTYEVVADPKKVASAVAKWLRWIHRAAT